MSKDDTKTKIEEEKISQAIEALKEKDWDINPLTIAEEISVDVKDVYRDKDAMALILEARDQDFTFKSPDEAEAEAKQTADLQKTIEELEKENNNLATKISELETGDMALPSEEINSQVMELLQSGTQDEIKQLEEELSQAYAQAGSKQEEIEELNRTIQGLERVNEAVNERLRELEDKNKELEEAEKSPESSEDQSALLEEKDSEIVELKRTVTGLEQVNESVNQRMRELEDENKQLKEAESNKETESSDSEKDETIRDLNVTISGLERVNEAINHRMRELEDMNKELREKEGGDSSQDSSEDSNANEKIARLEKDIEQLNEALKTERENQTVLSMTNSELEGKLTELQQEADAMAVQLQNAWHVGYEKGLAAAKQEEQADESAEKEVTVEEKPPMVAAAPEPPAALASPAAPTEPETPENINIEPAESKPVEEEAPVAQAQLEQVETHELKSDESAVINFTQAGPYVSSDFNPLKELKWRDLETVYSMGVLSIKDFNPEVSQPEPDTEQVVNLDEGAEQEPQPDPGSKDAQVDTSTNLDALNPEAAPQMHLDGMMEAGQTQFVSFAGNAEAPSALTEEQIQADQQASAQEQQQQEASPEIPDFDQLDIFEDIEELEELGKIEVPDDMLADVPVDEVVKEENATGEELRELIKNRIKQAQETKVEQTVRTPPAPGEEAEAKGGFSAKNKFVGQNAKPNEAAGAASATTSPNLALKSAPREIRKACAILGISPEGLTVDIVNNAWKKQIASPGVHPDLGGDTEAAVILNSAKDELLRFIESSAPKLGKKFGTGGAKDMSSRFTGKKKQ